MVKHTQNNSSTVAKELFECVDQFVGLALKGLSFRNDVFSKGTIQINVDDGLSNNKEQISW